MSPKSFVTGLGITGLLQVLFSLILIWLVPSIKDHSGFITVSILAMALFCTMMYTAARIFAKSAQTRLYIQLVMIAVFLKMLLCLALIIGYKKGFNPTDTSFIWPFLFIYVTSTLYEVIFLEKVGRQKQNPAS